MGFIMHCCKSTDSGIRRIAMRAWILGVLLLCSMNASAEGIVFKVVSLGEDNGAILLDLLEDYHLTDTMLEALENGVPLTFNTHIDIEAEDKPLWALFQGSLVEKVITRQLRYHPLSEEFEVRDLTFNTHRRFATREAALLALGEFREIKVVNARRLSKGAYYQVRIQAEHDIGALPLPLRPRAYLSPSWHLSSKVYEWRLRP